MSASVFTSERKEVLIAGLDDIVQKPFLAREGLNCVSRHMGVRYTYSDVRVKSAGECSTGRSQAETQT
jgi:DNA-binding response OmpR family regulator